jgi:hypothetical protein
VLAGYLSTYVKNFNDQCFFFLMNMNNGSFLLFLCGCFDGILEYWFVLGTVSIILIVV